MKVVISALQYRQENSGIGVLLRELFGRCAQDPPAECEVVLPADAPPFPHGGATQLRYAPCGYGQGLRRMAYQSFTVGRLAKDAVLLTTDSKTPFFLPRSCRLVPLVTDLAVYRMPKVYKASRAVWWRLQYRYVRRRAALYLAISEFTKRELTELLHIPPERVRVVPCAYDARLHRVTDPAALAALRQRYALPERYILFVGNANPRKNLARMLAAFDRLAQTTALPHHLVIAGGEGWKFDRAAALAGLACRERVHFLDFVPDDDIPALYSAAEVFVFPSLYEGFGIPVLEAQACGVPVLAADAAALPETAGDGALYVDPYSTQSLCDGMRRILEDPALAARLVQAGARNCKRFSWDASARILKTILEQEVL